MQAGGNTRRHSKAGGSLDGVAGVLLLAKEKTVLLWTMFVLRAKRSKALSRALSGESAGEEGVTAAVKTQRRGHELQGKGAPYGNNRCIST